MSLVRLVTLNLGHGIPKALKNLGQKTGGLLPLEQFNVANTLKCNHLKYAKERKQNQNLL